MHENYGRRVASPCLAVAALALSIAGSATAAETAVETSDAGFAELFSSHMVVQRDRNISVWGYAPAETELTLKLAGHEQSFIADASGHWRATLPALEAGGPLRMELSASGEVVEVLEDILVGDVWLCSGQSNMAFRVRQMNDSDRESANPPDTIRLLTVERHHATRPLDDFRAVTGWHVASQDTLAEFSSACFFFALNHQQDLAVPFGLINSSWGGSAIEPWISSSGLRRLGGHDQQLDLVALYGDDPAQALSRFVANWQAWWLTAGGASPGPWEAAYDDSGWTKAPPGLGDWQMWPDAGTEDFTGMVWYRKTFSLTREQALEGAVLNLGGVDELDVTWINGKPVGTRFGWGDPRRYDLEPGMLSAGENVLSVNVYNSWGAGGLNGPPEDIHLALADGGRISLGDNWRYEIVPGELGLPPKAPWESITGLTGLFNAMIAPLRGFGLAGAMWYQGESNTGRPPSYEALLNTMIADWRAALGATLPFIVVQLPNFGDLPEAPADSGWAQLRQDQQRVAMADPLTGLVVTLDSADRTDLHPPNKRIVGERAAAVARGLMTGGEELTDGIVPLRAERDGDRVVVHFDQSGLPLRVAGSAGAAGFELCGEQSGCHYAHAWLENQAVVIQADGFEDASEVRYAWADAPLVNLFGAQGLPVSSFRLAISASD